MERLDKIKFKEVDELQADLKAIKAKIGRWPKDEAELVSLRGKPMPLTHLRDMRPIPIQYIHEEGDPVYCLRERW